MKQKVNIFLFSYLIWISGSILNAQNETKIWYFGNHGGLDFNTSPPTSLTNSQMNTLEGCASIADASGNLLFYSDGVTIWDKTQSVMQNGANLNGNQSCSQACLIVKKPCDPSLYYVFTNACQDGSNNGLNYSIVDMTLASGNGSVISKNNPLFSSVTEKLCAVNHTNGLDIWVVTHDWNSNNFRAYLINGLGLNTTPVISSTGTIHNNSNNDNGIGCMKISPNGKKLGLAIDNYNNNSSNAFTSSFEVYDFDNSTGAVGNRLVLCDTLLSAYGCEFSPDNSKFYGSGVTRLRQWNLAAGSSSAIINSKQTVAISNAGYFGTIQMASNKKLYVARVLQNSLGVINSPDLSGSACNFTETGQSVLNSLYGLPNFVTSYFYPTSVVTISATSSPSMCIGESKILFAFGASTYTWNSNIPTSTLSVSPSVTTTYTVVGTTTAGCSFSSSLTITVNLCTGLEELAEPDFKIYPNPVTTTLILEAKTPVSQTVSVDLYNTLGNVLTSLEFSTNKYALNLDSLSEGVYYLKLQFGNQNKVYKIIKQ